jgi:hypothetical protein
MVTDSNLQKRMVSVIGTGGLHFPLERDLTSFNQYTEKLETQKKAKKVLTASGVITSETSSLPLLIEETCLTSYEINNRRFVSATKKVEPIKNGTRRGLNWMYDRDGTTHNIITLEPK